jgi:hypothetical protein
MGRQKFFLAEYQQVIKLANFFFGFSREILADFSKNAKKAR